MALRLMCDMWSSWSPHFYKTPLYMPVFIVSLEVDT